MDDTTVAGIAKALVQYHNNSFRTRVFGNYVTRDIDLPVCVEMNNLANRLTGDYSVTDSFMQMHSLNEIIRYGTQELEKVASGAAESDNASIFLDNAQKIYAEINAAKKLLEML